jgi:hypothetical protein
MIPNALGYRKRREKVVEGQAVAASEGLQIRRTSVSNWSCRTLPSTPSVNCWAGSDRDGETRLPRTGGRETRLTQFSAACTRRTDPSVTGRSLLSAVSVQGAR